MIYNHTKSKYKETIHINAEAEPVKVRVNNSVDNVVIWIGEDMEIRVDFASVVSTFINGQKQ
jgi:hypothetical protein